jgi:hypothetical protein
VFVLRTLPTEVALLLADETHGELEAVAVARLWTHPNRVPCIVGGEGGEGGEKNWRR